MIKYEWDYEEIDDNDDIVDHNHVERLEHFKPDGYYDAAEFRLVLVRDVFSDTGLVNRSWAYVNDGLLPEVFTDASGAAIARVPAIFKSELEVYKLNKQS